MKKQGLILVELLLAAVVTLLLAQRVGPFCWRHFGPDPIAYQNMLADNRRIMASNERIAAMRLEVAALQQEVNTKRASVAHLRGVRRDEEYKQAMVMFNAFTTRQANLYAKCSADGPLDPHAKNILIGKIWDSPTYIQDCKFFSPRVSRLERN